MTDVQQAAVAAGWHTDPANPAQLRWWDGRAWTTHVAPNPALVPVAAPQVTEVDPAQQQLRRETAYVPFQHGSGGESYYTNVARVAPGSAQTFPIWLIALSAFWAAGIIDLAAIPTQLGNPVSPAIGLPVSFLVAYGGVFALAWVDRGRIAGRGYLRLPSALWALLGPLGYLIARVVALGGKSVAPLVVYFSPVVLGIIAAIIIPILIAATRGAGA